LRRSDEFQQSPAPDRAAQVNDLNERQFCAWNAALSNQFSLVDFLINSRA
jgi:hypothetical protein